MTREDIDRIASEYFNDKESEQEMDEVFDLAKKALEKQKSKQNKGIVERCIITYPHGEHNRIYECPCCHASNSSVFKNYCPNCGVRMVEPQKSEDKE